MIKAILALGLVPAALVLAYTWAAKKAVSPLAMRGWWRAYRDRMPTEHEAERVRNASACLCPDSHSQQWIAMQGEQRAGSTDVTPSHRKDLLT
jgi:hypothetical protein